MVTVLKRCVRVSLVNLGTCRGLGATYQRVLQEIEQRRFFPPKLPLMMDSCLQKAAEVSNQHPKPDIKFAYGTAGFRTRADTLDSVMFRMGLLAVLRSKAKSGQAIGMVVTASHNPVHDNGVKLVDPFGEMLQPSWERHASELANAEDVVEILRGVVTEHSIDWNVPAKVFIARDTRPSGVQLVKAIADGIEALGGSCHDYGEDRRQR